MISLTINEKEVVLDKPGTVLEAAKQAGIRSIVGARLDLGLTAENENESSLSLLCYPSDRAASKRVWVCSQV